MARPTREQVFTALFALLNGNVAGITTYNRRFALPSLVATNIGPLPVLMLWEQPEKTVQAGPNTPAQKIWRAWIVIVFQNPSQPDVQNPGAATPGATIINPLIDAVEAVIFPSPAPGQQSTQTLGGIVAGVWIDGETVKETGDTDTNGLGGAVIPLKILVP